MKRSEGGFTLIELLVVVAIIGILVAIAIPQFATYRTQANNSAAQAQLRQLATSMEAYFANFQAYATGTSGLSDYGYRYSNNVTVSITSTTSTTWVATSYHSAGDRTYTWNSNLGGLQ